LLLETLDLLDFLVDLGDLGLEELVLVLLRFHHPGKDGVDEQRAGQREDERAGSDEYELALLGGPLLLAVRQQIDADRAHGTSLRASRFGAMSAWERPGARITTLRASRFGAMSAWERPGALMRRTSAWRGRSRSAASAPRSRVAGA